MIKGEGEVFRFRSAYKRVSRGAISQDSTVPVLFLHEIVEEEFVISATDRKKVLNHIEF